MLQALKQEKKMNINKKSILGTVILSATLFVGCSSDSDNSILEGRFIDSPVQGLTYVSGSVEGTTDENGTFTYEAGQMVSFFIGDIELGTTEGAAVLTPVELVPSATDETHPTVTNIIRVLQTLDDDGDTSNGIVISESVTLEATNIDIDFTLSISNFENDSNLQAILSDLTELTSAGARPLVSVSEAQTHFNQALIDLLVGEYSGTFTGGDSGTFSFTANNNGTINGTGFSNTDNESFSFTGSFTSDGTGAAFGTVEGGATFELMISRDGTITGNWESDLFDISGTISGGRN